MNDECDSISVHTTPPSPSPPLPSPPLPLTGHVMSRLLDDSDVRQQVELDSELPVRWKLLCGAIAGATGQSG